MQACWITAVSAFSAIRRGSIKLGKYEPFRSLRADETIAMIDFFSRGNSLTLRPAGSTWGAAP